MTCETAPPDSDPKALFKLILLTYPGVQFQQTTLLLGQSSVLLLLLLDTGIPGTLCSLL